MIDFVFGERNARRDAREIVEVGVHTGNARVAEIATAVCGVGNYA